MNVPVGCRKRLPDRGPGHQRIGVHPAIAGVELEPVVALRFALQLRVVGRVGDGRAGRDVAHRLIAGREHREDELLGLGFRERTRDILGRDARGPHQGHAQAGHVQGIAGARPERAPRPAERAGVGVVADVVVQEVEDVLRRCNRAPPLLPG